MGAHVGGVGFELFEGDVEFVDGGAVGGGGGVEEETTVGESGLAGTGFQQGEEVSHKDEVVGVDGLELGAAVFRVLHPVRQTIHGDQDGRTTLEVALEAGRRASSSKLGPQGLEDGPRGGWILNTNFGKLLQGHTRLGNWQGRVLPRDLQFGQDLLVRSDCTRQQGSSSFILDVKSRL